MKKYISLYFLIFFIFSLQAMEQDFEAISESTSFEVAPASTRMARSGQDISPYSGACLHELMKNETCSECNRELTYCHCGATVLSCLMIPSCGASALIVGLACACMTGFRYTYCKELEDKKSKVVNDSSERHLLRTMCCVAPHYKE